MRAVNLRVNLPERRDFLTESGEIKKLGFEGIVKVRGVVSNFIDPIDKLGFEGRAQIEQVLGQLRKFRGGIVARMLDDAFANFKREIQAGKIEVAMF